MKLVNVCGHSFFPDLIEKGDIILDCGANQGDFSRWCSQQLDSRIISFEADPDLFSQLPDLENVEFIEAAVAARSGRISFALGASQCSSAIFMQPDKQQIIDVPAISLNDVCLRKAPGMPVGLLKLDIEGAELDVLESLQPVFLKQVRQISVEFHDFLDPVMSPRVRAVSKQLEGEGFYLVRFSHSTWGDCLFINRDLCEVKYSQRIKLHAYDKYWKGILRNLNNRLTRLRSHSKSS